MSQTRFVTATEAACVRKSEVLKEFFPALAQAKIEVLFDTKKRVKGGKMVLGRILRANDLIRKLTDNLADEGCDYILFLDQIAYEAMPTVDQERLVRHELRHCKVVGTPENPRYKIVPHDIEDFEVEIALNQDDIGWARRSAALAEEIYSQMEDSQKDQNKKTKKEE